MPEENADILTAPSLISHSSLLKKISDRLVSPFNTMTTFYFRRSVERAFQMDEQPPDLSLNMNKALTANIPYITSTVDDVMYMVNQVVEKAVSTAQRDVIGSVIPTIARVLGSDFVGMIQRKMRDESYPRAAIQGGLPPEHLIVAFLVLLNNLDVSNDYIRRIVQTRLEPVPVPGAISGEAAARNPLSDVFPFNHDTAYVTNALQSLQSSFETKSSELLMDGIYLIFRTVMKPRLRPVLADTFRDIDYALTEDDLEELARAAANDEGEENLAAEDLVPRRFQHGWEALTKPIARILTPANYDRLLSQVIAYLGEVLEKRIWTYHGRINSSGAVRLERDIANIISLVVRGQKYSLRDAFARCTQICLVMNMEDDEWEELQRVEKAGEGSGVDWKIDAGDKTKAKSMMRGA
jgi:hypothetical protein